MRNQKIVKPQLSSLEIMIKIMDDVEKINVGRFNHKYLPRKERFTRAISVSLEDTCKRLGIRATREVEFRFSERFKTKWNKKYGGIVDYIVTNTDGTQIAIEIDSTNKNLSYEKLEELSERGYDTFWILWKRNKSRIPYNSSYKNDCSLEFNKLGYTNKNVNIVKHIFQPTVYTTKC